MRLSFKQELPPVETSMSDMVRSCFMIRFLAANIR
jgi:hypothetical protein